MLYAADHRHRAHKGHEEKAGRMRANGVAHGVSAIPSEKAGSK